MNYGNFSIPAIVAAKINISPKVIAIWKKAVWTVRQGQEKFLEAYKATIDEQIPGWKDNWKTDPMFARRLGEIEDYMKRICRQNDMSLVTWNRYRTAARKAMLLGTPFQFAAQNYTVEEARAIAEGGKDVAKEMRKTKNLHHAATIVANYATILPVPKTDDNVHDYLDLLTFRLAEHLERVRETFGPEAVERLKQALTKEEAK